ncbi:THAP domain-containing protein 7 [Heptranchias perlo]|uniref:THAP domain-containing protein 7 n=1 Tax=Heptranchias perlo TaxID=212740 RepID=UPI00355A6CD8
MILFDPPACVSLCCRVGYLKMPRHCSAEGCRSRDTRDSRRNGITFHRLPKKGKCQREIWLLNCCRKNPEGTVPWDPPSQFVYFCSKHFEKHCFELVGLSGYHRLRDDAMPTIFQPCLRRNVAVNGEKATEIVCVSECLTDDTSLPAVPCEEAAADPGSPHNSTDTGFRISLDGSAFVLDYSDPRGTLGESVSVYETSPTDSSLSTTRPELEASSPHLIYLIDVDSQPGGFEGPGNQLVVAEDTSSNISPAQPGALTEQSASSQEELDNDKVPIPIALYMARIPSPPPKPGAYISVEHSYTVGCPLVWKKRAEAVKEAFEKASKELRASRKRESRLRARITSLLRPRERRLQERLTESDLTKDFPSQFEMFEVQVMDESLQL